MRLSHYLYRLLPLLLTALLAGLQPAVADHFPRVSFVPLSSDILPSNEVRKLYQDSDGYIWIPTYNGLARYDGYGSVIYGMREAADVPFNPFVNVVAEDHDKQLWIGTERGLFRMNKITGAISTAECETLSECNISVILCDAGNDIWVGCDKGLFRKDASEHYFRSVPLIDSEGNTVEGITSVVQDNKLNLWIAAFGKGLLRYDIREARAYSFDDSVLRRAHVAFCDSAGNIWVGTWGAGLVRLVDPYTPGQMHYVHYQHQTGRENSLLDDIVYAIEEDRTQNTIWVGGRSGLSILYRQDDPDSFQNFRPGESAGDLPYNEVNSILRARDNLMWIGMLGGGVCKIQTGDAKFESDRLESVRARYGTSSIKCIYYAGEGDFWLSLLDYGLIQYNIRSGRVVDYREHPDLSALPYTSTVNDIFRRTTTGELCFGTQNAGVWIYDEARHTVRQLNRYNRPQFRDDCVIALAEDPAGNLWIGSRTGVYIDTAEGDFKTLREWLGAETPFDSACVFDLCCDKKGDIWIASNGHGILHVGVSDRSWRQFNRAHGMTTDHIYCLSTDDSGRVWAGTVGDGLAVYEPAANRFKAVTAFPNIGNKGVGNIARDENGRMWITTTNAVFSFSPDAHGVPEHINTYIVSADMQTFFFNRNSSAQIDHGRIVFGGSNGLVIFNGNRVQPLQSHLPLVLTDFRVYNHSLRNMPDAERLRITTDEIGYANRVTLTHAQNNFNIEFSMLSYANPRDHIYRYMLEGFDREFISADSHHRFASYSNLPAGTYTFRLQAAGENGVWSSNERRLEVTILPAPWLSWWAWTIYGLLLVAVAYGVIRFVRYRLRMQHEVQISKFERQKTEELNHAKLQFFTNVTHELMTPLTIIITSLESLNNQTGDARTLYAVMSSNATRLMRLIQQILEFRKVESGNLKIRVSQGEVISFVRKCVEAFAPLVARKQLKVYFQPSAERVEGWFDSDKLDKIVYNLLSNAAKYTPEGGEITIRIEACGEESVVLSVINSGERMSQQTIDGLFKRFYDGNYRKFHTIGTGIGLSLVKDLTDIHKGTIRVSSDAEGNCFRVTLPISRSAYAAEQIDESTPLESPAEELMRVDASDLTTLQPLSDAPDASLSPRHTLLIVDDNEELRLLMSNLLAPYFRIETASDGEQALRKLACTTVDLVVSDIMMPVMDGIELCRRIKSTFEYCHIPVILLTAKNADENRIEGYNSGADGYVTKPFNLQLLYAQIQNQLKKLEYRGSHFRNQLVFEVEKLEYTSMDEEFMRRAMDCVNAHIANCEFSQADFTREMNMSRTVLTEKLKSLTGLTPAAFILDVRLRAARHLLEKEPKIRIADLAFASGFNDPKYFSTCFRKKFGLSPKELSEQLGDKGEKIC